MRRVAIAAIAVLVASVANAETYRLIHALGNSEREVARGLSKGECTVRKRELIATAEALGTHNEKLGIGSITCLPESVFDD